MANDFSLGVASGGVDTGLTAAGTTIADALQLAAAINVFGTVAASSGAKLIAGVGRGNPIVVRNGTATNAVAVYPATSTGTINGGSAGAAFSVAATKSAVFYPHGSDNWTAVLGA
jgi:hypothetical protein